LEDRWVPATLFVDDGGGAGKFTSIQAAVDAAKHGDTILVAPGTYTEQVVVPDSKDRISIVSQKPQQAVIQEPATLSPASRSVVDVQGAKDVTIAGFTIRGPGGAFAGVQVQQKGSATIIGNTITSIRQDPLGGALSGIGIVLGGGGTPGSATIIGNTITDYQKEGITVAYAQSSAVIVGNTITGAGPTAVVPQNGIDVNSGADAYIAGNTVSGNVYTVDNSAAGIAVVEGGHITIAANQVKNNSNGIVVQFAQNPSILLNDVSGSVANGIELDVTKNATVAGNRVTGSGKDGIILRDSTNADVELNVSRSNGGSGVRMVGDSAHNDITRNDLRGNTGPDAADETTGKRTGGTADTWAANLFDDSSPGGLR
jgi:parallel beta-helix repeat protein